VTDGKVVDLRATLLVHETFDLSRSWRIRQPEEVLGLCMHQTASSNQDPALTAQYHVSPGEHVTRDSHGCPTVLYPFFVDKAGKVFLTVEPQFCTWSQGDEHTLGDENRHLLAMVAMGYYDKTHSTPLPQVHAIYELCSWLLEGLALPESALYCHSDFGKPPCPGPDLELSIRNRRAPFLSGNRLQNAMLTLYALQAPLGDIPHEPTEMTRKLLVQYQKQHNINVTGVFDLFTVAYLLDR